MLSRKLFALFVLIGALGFFVLMYLYFFVYYTATLVIVANEDNYSGELVSIKNAQNRKFSCVQKECTLTDIPPFDYRLSLFKEDFKTETLSLSLQARSVKNIEINFERQARLNLESVIDAPWESETILIPSLPQLEGINPEDIRTEKIVGTMSEIFISAGNTSFIYDTIGGILTELPFTLPVSYIKTGTLRGSYQVVTEVGTFLYSRQSGASIFQYLFFDYVVLSEEQIIGIVRSHETEKRQNFSLPESKDTLILLYNSRTHERQVLLSSPQEITRIEMQDAGVFFTTTENIRYKLENY